MKCQFRGKRKSILNQFHPTGVVPESQSKVEEEGALWPDAAGPNTFLHCLRAASSNTAWELRTGMETMFWSTKVKSANELLTFTWNSYFHSNVSVVLYTAYLFDSKKYLKQGCVFFSVRADNHSSQQPIFWNLQEWKKKYKKKSIMVTKIT